MAEAVVEDMASLCTAAERRAWRPLPRTTIAQWAEANRRLSAKQSRFNGPFRKAHNPVLIGLLTPAGDSRWPLPTHCGFVPALSPPADTRLSSKVCFIGKATDKLCGRIALAPLLSWWGTTIGFANGNPEVRFSSPAFFARQVAPIL